MRFDTVIRNATVVTATDTCVADVGIAGETSAPSPPNSPPKTQEKSSTLPACS